MPVGVISGLLVHKPRTKGVVMPVGVISGPVGPKPPKKGGYASGCNQWTSWSQALNKSGDACGQNLWTGGSEALE